MMMMTRTGLAVVAAGFALVFFFSPLAARQQTPTFRSGVQTVAIYATVVDSAGRLVPDLEQKDFEVFDEGKKQEITVFKTDVQPVSVVVMLDTSGSMTASLELLKNAAEKFVIRLLPQDRGRIGSFSDKIVIGPTFTSDRDELVRYLHEDIDYGNPTALWDAINVSMNALSHEQNRRVVLVFTDGDDNSSRLSLGDVMRRAQAEEYMVYAIGLQSHVLGTVTKPDAGLKKIAAETGGGYFELKNTADLNSTFTRVADELHRQYVLGFSPKLLDGRLHKLDVVAARPGMTTRARKSYLADKPK
jgi:Ca-activated chloride channel family protein